MFSSFNNIFKTFLVQKKYPLRVPSKFRTIFWRTPFLDGDQTASLLEQWQMKAPTIDHLFGDQKRYVFPQLEMAVGERVFIPKVYKVRKLSQNLIALAFSEAERNCATQAYLFKNDILVPLPAGVLNTYKHGWLIESVFFQEKLPASSLAYKQYLTSVQNLDLEARQTFFTQLGHELAKVHSLGVYTEDTDQNMFVEATPTGSFRFHFFDFDNFYPWRYPNLRRTSHAIRHYATSKNHVYNAEEVRLFLGAYLETRGKTHWRDDIMNDLNRGKAREASAL